MTAIAIATFASEGPFLRARLRAVTEDRRILGEWLPYASEGMEPGDPAIRTAAILSGILGALALFALTCWSAMSAYPFNSGGRPLWSWPALLPSPIEFGALCGAIAAVVLFFRRAGLTRLHHPAFDLEEVARASQDSFVLALGCDAGDDAAAALALLVTAGATHSHVVRS